MLKSDKSHIIYGLRALGPISVMFNLTLIQVRSCLELCKLSSLSKCALRPSWKYLLPFVVLLLSISGLANGNPPNVKGLGHSTSNGLTVAIDLFEFHDDVTCYGGSDGSVDLVVTGTLFFYAVDWLHIPGGDNPKVLLVWLLGTIPL